MSEEDRSSNQDPSQPGEPESPRSAELGTDDLGAVSGGLGFLRPSIPTVSIGARLPASKDDTCITRL